METIEYRTMDKSSWGEGPWQDEPDKLQYEDEATGLPCLIKRNHAGALCGYVGVTEGHPAYDKPYDDVDRMMGDWYVHGGLTYSDFCQEGPEDKTICHLPSPGEPDRVYWLGFDCNHYMDFAPALAVTLREVYAKQGKNYDDEEYAYGRHEKYKNLSYVKEQVAELAQHLNALTEV